MSVESGERVVKGKFCTLCRSVAVRFKHESGEWEEPYCSGDCTEVTCNWCKKESVPTNYYSGVDINECINCGKKNAIEWDEMGGCSLHPYVDQRKTSALYS